MSEFQVSEHLKGLTDWEAVKKLICETPNGGTRVIVETEMAGALKRRVKGQDHVVDDLVHLLRLEWGKQKRKKPIANLLFLGPTGTGKTEMVKAMAEYLYDDEKAVLQFDCSELHGEEGKTRLIGTPLGYVGSDSGGQLTRPIINNPRQIVAFDEIEKAYTKVFDLFLQMMGDGVLTEQGSGKKADFTQAIIVLTSNAEAEPVGKIQDDVKDPHEMVNAVKTHLADTKVFRPEIVGRIDKIYVFKPLEGPVMAEIAALKMLSCAKSYGLELDYIDPRLIHDCMVKSEKQKKFGIRSLERIVDELLGEAFIAAKEAGGKRVRLDFDDDGNLRVSPAGESGPVEADHVG
jgi:ATP-dependent Clp protease ATP-binding subunit ClpC